MFATYSIGASWSNYGSFLTPLWVHSSDALMLSTPVVNAVTAAVKTLVDGIFEEGAWLTDDKAVFSIVLDDFGSHPVFIRGLCAVRNEIRFALKETLFRPLHGVELRLIVVGTWIEVKERKIGSYPNSFVAVTMHSNPPMLRMLKASLELKLSEKQL